jgi:predicted nucleic acid-binding protein
MYLLDTNVLSELRKARSGRAAVAVVTWAGTVKPSALYVSAITIMELELGVVRVERRDAVQGALLRTWMNQHVLPTFSERVLPVDTAVALRCAHLHVPDPGAERDTLIAATALVHGLTLVTRNVADFEGRGVDLLNPWG